MNTIQRACAQSLVIGLMAAIAASCSSGGGGSSGSSTPTPSSASSGGTTSKLPPLAAPVSLDDNHQVGTVHWSNGDTSDGAQGQTVAGLSCGDPPQTFHIHTHLSIFLNGEALAIPANIGFANPSPTTTCHYTLHTHDLSGKIHVEAAAQGTYTLGQFFQIWGQPLTTTNVAGLTDNIVFYVTDNGVVALYSGDPSKITLVSHREITIQVGTPISEIPNYTWSGN